MPEVNLAVVPPVSANVKFAPTAEQQAILEAASRLRSSGQVSLKISAYAGSGKTSTLKLIANGPFKGCRSLYIAFNSAIAKDARNSFPSSVEVKTLHSVARRALNVGHGESGNLNARFVAQIIGENSKDWLTKKGMPRALTQAKWIAAALTLFCQSADSELGRRHIQAALDRAVYRIPTSIQDTPEAHRIHEEHMTLREAAAKLLGKLCPRVWAAVSDWRRNGMTPPHDCYLKMFQLDDELIETTMSEFEYVMLDECQDLNPVMTSIAVKSQRPLIAVGDSYQQIYSWRGADDALEFLPGALLHLSQSFRFGDEIADLAWATLTNKPQNRPTVKLRGNPTRNSVIDDQCDAIITNGAVVARTNAGVLRAAADVALSGRPVHIVGGIDALAADLRSALALYQGRRKDVVVESLKRFESWADLKLEAEDSDDVGLQKLIDAIEGGKALRDLAAIEKMHVADEARAAVIVSTVHKSKGREWSTVTQWNDFPTPAKLLLWYENACKQEDEQRRREMIKAVLEEYHVAYVAITRAVDRLVRIT